MTKQLLVLTAIVPALCACGQSPMPNMGTAPSAVSLSTESGSGKSSTRFVQGPNSCPTEAPKLHQPNVRGLTVLLTWNEVPSIHDYYLEIDRYDATNVYMNVANLVVDDTGSTKWMIPEDGRFRVRIRTHTSCDTLGNWSAYEYFSTGTGGGHVEPPPPGEEFFLEIGNGNSDEPPSGDGPSGNGPSGDGPPTGGGSNGNDHQCNNGSTGDHNTDGHVDCGLKGNGQGQGQGN